MNTHDLGALAARITAPMRTTGWEARFFELVPPALDLLVRGTPVSPEALAAAAGRSPEEVRAVLGRVAGVD